MRSGGQIRWQGIVTVALTATVYCVPFLPFSVFIFALEYSPEVPSVHFCRLAWYHPMLNIMSNFYIYCLTISSFRRFLLSKLGFSRTFAFAQRVLPEETIQLEVIPSSSSV